MAIRPIVTAPDPVLRGLSAPTAAFGGDLEALARDLLDTMYAAPGRGLAAVQVGVRLRLFVMDATWREGRPDPRVFLDPEVVAASEGRAVGEEGCLSIPGRTAWVSRHESVRLRWRDGEGVAREEEFAGFAARCVQHEMDHLDGILCTDLDEPRDERPEEPGAAA